MSPTDDTLRLGLTQTDLITNHPGVHSNYLGDEPIPLPSSAISGPVFQPQIRVDPVAIRNSGTGWEECVILAHSLLPDGSGPIYGYKWAFGGPTSADVLHNTFVALTHFPNGTFYRGIVHDGLGYVRNVRMEASRIRLGMIILFGIPRTGFWNTSVNAGAWIVETHTEKWALPAIFLFLRDSPKATPRSVEPETPLAPTYKWVPSQLSDGFSSWIEVPPGHTDGHMIFPGVSTSPFRV